MPRQGDQIQRQGWQSIFYHLVDLFHFIPGGLLHGNLPLRPPRSDHRLRTHPARCLRRRQRALRAESVDRTQDHHRPSSLEEGC